MAFETVNERRNALNLGLFGLNNLMFIALDPDGSFSEDDSENALGFYIGLDVEVSEEWTAPDVNIYKGRAQWRRLGQSRDRVYRIIVSDAVKWVITGAFIEGEPIQNETGNDSTGYSWRRLGRSRDRVYRITVSDAVKWVVSNAFVETE